MKPEDSAATVAAGLQAAKDYADLVVKPPLEQLGGLFADTIGFWRLKNRVNCMLKAKKFLEAKGVTPRVLQPSVFVPLLEEAGNTDDPDLTEMFARLLATHLDPDAHEVHPSFAKVLGQLSPLDTKVLRFIDDAEHSKVKDPDCRFFGHLDIIRKRELANDLPKVDKRIEPAVNKAELALATENLLRLGVIEDHEWLTALEDFCHFYQGIRTSHFGRRFLKACSPPDYWRHKPVESTIKLSANKSFKMTRPPEPD